MEEEDVREVLRSYGVDLWELIDASVALAARNDAAGLRRRRDGIVAKLYAAEGGGSAAPALCRRCDAGSEAPSSGNPGGGAAAGAMDLSERGGDGGSPEVKRSGSSSTPRSEQEEEDEDDGGAGDGDEQVELRNGHDLPIDAEQRQIFAIKDRIEDPDQPEGVLVKHLQRLLDMDISFKALKETDVGRSVNGLRKHPSGEVRRFVKQLVKKWKELVDEWVKSNSDGASPAALTDGDSPQTGSLHSSSHQNGGHHQAVLDFGGMAAEIDSRRKVPPPPPPTMMTTKPASSMPPSVTTPARAKEQQQEKNSAIDAERLASARRRLHENYQEAQNAKKQRTIQVMDIHEIPKPKNAFFPRNNKGGGGGGAKHW